MPVISRFFGIVISMYFNDHSPPHFHAEYTGLEAAYTIDTLELLRGGLPGRAHAMVLEWAAAHRIELRENWERAREQVPLKPVAPLT